MSRRILKALGVALFVIVVPIASAAAFEKLSDLAVLLKAQNGAWDTTGEIHGHFQEYYMSAWFDGSAEGNKIATMKEKMAMTLDIAGGPFNMRLKGYVRIADGNGYVYVDTINGKYDNDLLTMTGEFQTKKWLKFPLTEVAAAEEEYQPQDYSFLDDAFDLSSTSVGGKTVYSATLKRSILRDILKELRQMDASSFPSNSGYTPANVVPSVKVLATATVSNDKIVSASIEGDVIHPMASLSWTVNATLRIDPVTVTIPTDAVDMSAFTNSLPMGSSMPFGDLIPNPEPSSPAWEPDVQTPDSGWNSSESVSPDWSSTPETTTGKPICTPDDPGLIRRGLCEFPKN